MTNVQYDIEDYKDCEIINMYHERLEKGYSKDEIMKSIYAKGRDNARTPMQWDDSANAGFTTGTPWIKVNDNYDKINAKSQVDDPDSIFSCYKKLVQLRKDYPVFVDGKFTLLLEDDENIFAYSRKNEEKTMIVVCNFFDKEIPMPLAKECEGMEVLISNYKDTSDMSVLKPYEARMYIR
jgi:glucan 1,6-alpha-glucosidase